MSRDDYLAETAAVDKHGHKTDKMPAVLLEAIMSGANKERMEYFALYLLYSAEPKGNIFLLRK